MFKIAAAMLLVTSLGNAAPAPNTNLDATPPPAANTAPAAPAQFNQPGPPADQTIQHGVVDPRGTDALPLAVKVVSMPPRLDAGPQVPPPPAPDGDTSLVWVLGVLGALQAALMAALVYFVMQGAAAMRRTAEAVERVLARSDAAP